MAVHIDAETSAFVTDRGPTNVYAKRTPRGRWQYRMGGTTAKHDLLASGMTPAAFVRSFWMRDDYIETPEHTA